MLYVMKRDGKKRNRERIFVCLFLFFCLCHWHEDSGRSGFNDVRLGLCVEKLRCAWYIRERMGEFHSSELYFLNRNERWRLFR